MDGSFGNAARSSWRSSESRLRAAPPHNILGTTISGGLCPSAKVLMLINTFLSISIRPSLVADLIWGSSTTLGSSGSRGVTARPALSQARRSVMRPASDKRRSCLAGGGLASSSTIPAARHAAVGSIMASTPSISVSVGQSPSIRRIRSSASRHTASMRPGTFAVGGKVFAIATRADIGLAGFRLDHRRLDAMGLGVILCGLERVELQAQLAVHVGG